MKPRPEPDLRAKLASNIAAGTIAFALYPLINEEWDVRLKILVLTTLMATIRDLAMWVPSLLSERAAKKDFQSRCMQFRMSAETNGILNFGELCIFLDDALAQLDLQQFAREGCHNVLRQLRALEQSGRESDIPKRWKALSPTLRREATSLLRTISEEL